MAGLKHVYILASILLSSCIADRVPVLMWGTHKTENQHGHPSALENITPDEFYHHVKKTTSLQHKSLVIVFLEENLSVEDFSWRDSENKITFPRLQSVSTSAQFVNFLASVHAPLKGLKSFQKDGYDVHHIDLQNGNTESAQVSPAGKKNLLILELDDAKTNEDRPNFLRRHDDIISEVYTAYVEKGYQVTAIYTGRHSSWVEPENLSRKHRVRRLLADVTNITIPGSLWASNDSTILFYSKSSPYVERGGARTHNLTGTPDVVSNVSDSSQTVEINFAGNVNLSVEFPLSGGYWTMNVITLQIGSEQFSLKTYPAIEAPLNFSYHCSQNVIFSNAAENISLVFESFQVQPFLQEQSFGDTYDCVGFFTSVIWSVLFVTLLLGSILVWGLGMLMSIKTMDQFDDPKGKTIQVTTTE